MPDKALVLLDYQEALCGQGSLVQAPPLAAAAKERGVVALASKLLEAARKTGVRVIHVRLAFDPTYVLRTNRLARFDKYPSNSTMNVNSPEAAIVAPLQPTADEPVINKGCVDPFVGTPLQAVLAAEGITDVWAGGVATNVVVESFARHGSDLGLQIRIVEDMCASFADDLHEFSMTKIMPMFGRVTTTAEALEELA